ncbi:MAG: LolA family protein [Streptosporangiaceae bacterium]
MTTPPQIAIGDLVPLLYRSGWAQFSLSGEVRARTAEARSRSWEERETCEIGPDGRYRVEVTDGEGDRELLTGDAAGSWVPFPSLMVPASGLLPDFELQIVERAEFLGRAVIAITGSPRLASRQQLARMSGLIDAELGILLRYQLVSRTRTDSAEFTRLTVSPRELAAPDHDTGPSSGSPSVESPPAQSEPVFSDEEVNLLYRSGLGPQQFMAQLSEQADTATMIRLANEAAAATKFGNRHQWLLAPLDDQTLPDVDRRARLAVAMPGRYLIEATTDPGSKPTLIACNGERLWRAYADRVAVSAAKPLPREIATIIDPAWLLSWGWQVSVLGEAVVDGRPALHVRAAGNWPPPQSGPLSGRPVFSDEVEVFIDRALGLCLRQVNFLQGHPVLRTELTDLTAEANPTLFDFMPPPGVKIIKGGLLAETGQTPARLAFHVAKGTAGLAFDLGRRWLSRNDPGEPGR